MFNKPKPNPVLEAAINEALDHLNTEQSPNDESYEMILEKIERLYKLRNHHEPERISRDTLAIVCGNLVGIAMIVGYERANVIGSKALGFVMKAR